MNVEKSNTQESFLQNNSGYMGEPERAKILLNDSKDMETDRDQSQTVQKLRSQNEKLRGQLKELSYKLTETLEKVKNKKNPEKTATEFREETLRKELENSTKQITSYKREIEKLKFKLDTTHTADRVTQLENLLREKDRVIEEMTMEKRNLEKIKRDQEKHLDQLRNERDYITKLNMYAEEVKALKDKIRDMQKHEKHEEKSFKKQQEYLVILEGKYREVCEKAGVSSSLNFTTAQDINDRNLKFKPKVRESVGISQDLRKLGAQSAKNGRRVLENEEGSVDGSEPVELTEAKFKELKNIINILKKSKGAQDRKTKGEFEQMMSKMRDMEFDNKVLTGQLRDKDKELNILQYKFNELKRLSKHNHLNPIDNNSAVVTNTSKLTEKNLSQIRSAGNLNNNALPPKVKSRRNSLSSRRGGRREKKGRVTAKVPEFDDTPLIDTETKISKLTFWYDQDQIYGVRAFYSIQSGADIGGKEHLEVETKDGLECHSIEIDSDDRIAIVSGKYKTHLGYLKIVTSKGISVEFGYEDSKNSVQSFIFDIENNEHPSIVFGGLDKLDDNNLALAYLGFQMKKIDPRDEIRDDL